jgi:hypothetical protein
MTYLAGQLEPFVLPSTYITALALALTSQGTCQSLLSELGNSAIVKVSQRKGYNWSGEEAMSEGVSEWRCQRSENRYGTLVEIAL